MHGNLKIQLVGTYPQCKACLSSGIVYVNVSCIIVFDFPQVPTQGFP